ncbi:DUF2155 domain-containing protein [Roseivivax sp.]
MSRALRSAVLTLALGAAALPGLAQDTTIITPQPRPEGAAEGLEGADPDAAPRPLPEVDAGPAVVSGSGAVLRTLDKLNGTTEDLNVPSRQAMRTGRIEVAVAECRYPAGDPARDAYAYVIVREVDEEQPVFAGWMIASAPTINPMDHARYDVWVLRCATS